MDHDFIRRITEQQQQMRRMLDGPLRYLRETEDALVSATKTIRDLEGSGAIVKLFTAAEALRDMHSRLNLDVSFTGSAMKEIFSKENALVAMARSLELKPIWKQYRAAEDALKAFQFPENTLAAVSAHVLDIQKYNATIAGALSSTTFDNLAFLDARLERRVLGLGDSYRDLFAGLIDIEGQLAAVPDFVTTLPPRDMLVKATIISSYDVDFEPTQTEIDLDDPVYARADVDYMLAKLNPNYVTMLDEAFEAYRGRSVGRVRHVSVSLRELCMHVLHDLSPDTAVEAWTKDPHHYDKGKPIREARVLYICRGVEYAPYPAYVHESIRTTITFFRSVNKNTHEVRPEVSEYQLRLMLVDAIDILRFLLKTAGYDSQ